MKKWFRHVRSVFSRKGFPSSFGLTLLFLFIGLLANFYAGQYAKLEASNPVTDLILNNIPVFDVDGSFVYGPIAFWTFVVALSVLDPRRVPFAWRSITLLLLVRSLFVSLTHIGPFPTHLYVNSNLFTLFTSGGDLFFSGHTAFPFLMALVYWNRRQLRYLFLALSAFFGTVVLMAHLHYSIDVLAAFFITHTVYYLATVFFKKDQALFESSL